MEPILVYQEGSDTIRQMPQNYLIAHRIQGRWICEPDLAADRELASRVFGALWEHSVKYGGGLNLLSKVTPNKDLTKLTNNEIQIIRAWKKQHKLSKKDTSILVEAYRRFNKDTPNMSKQDAIGLWLGLGSPSKYKSKYFVSFDGKLEKGIDTWWVLTSIGIVVMWDLQTKLTWRKELCEILFNDINYLIKE